MFGYKIAVGDLPYYLVLRFRVKVADVPIPAIIEHIGKETEVLPRVHINFRMPRQNLEDPCRTRFACSDVEKVRSSAHKRISSRGVPAWTKCGTGSEPRQAELKVDIASNLTLTILSFLGGGRASRDEHLRRGVIFLRRATWPGDV